MPQPPNKYQRYYQRYISSPEYRRRLKNMGYGNEVLQGNQMISDFLAQPPRSQIDYVVANRLGNVNASRLEITDDYWSTAAPPNLVYVNPREGLPPVNGKPNIDMLAAHEYGHKAGSMKPDPSIDPYLSPSPREIEELTKRNKARAYKEDHEGKPEEAKADIESLRFLIEEGGLGSPTQPMNKQRLKKASQLPAVRQSMIFERLQRRYDDDDLIWLMNNLAKTDTQLQVPTAANGYTSNNLLNINNSTMPDPTKSKGRRASQSSDEDIARANRILELSQQWGVPTNRIFSQVQRGAKNIHTGYTPRLSTQYYSFGPQGQVAHSITDRYENTDRGYSAAAYNTTNLANAEQSTTAVTPATPIPVPEPTMNYGGTMPRKSRGKGKGYANFGTSMGWDQKNQYQGYFDWGGAIPPFQHIQDGYMVPDTIDAQFPQLDWGGAIPPNQRYDNGYFIPSNIHPGGGPNYQPSTQDKAAMQMTKRSMGQAAFGTQLPDYWARHMQYGGDTNFPNPTAYFEEDEIPQAYNGYSGYHRMPDGSLMRNDQMANGGGLSRKEDYGSKEKPYPSVRKGDFAGGNRSYPIPTKADAIDALRLASLHGRDDVKAKVYKKYPSLKKADYGIKLMTNGGIIPSSIQDYYESMSQYQPQFAQSGIKIKPENRGKFNATKQRTGKTTEELTHSKNPLTRKRAIFAQNASKWNKGQYGLDLEPINTLPTPSLPQPDISLTNTPNQVQDYLSMPTPNQSVTGRNTTVSNKTTGAPSIRLNTGSLFTGLAGITGQAANQARSSNEYARQVRQSMMQPGYNPYMSGTGYTNLYQDGGIVPGNTYDLTQDQIAFLRNQGYDIEIMQQ